MTAEEFILENLISMGDDISSVVVEEVAFEAIDFAEKEVAQQVHKMISEGVTTKYSNKWTTRTAFTTNVGGGDFGTVTVTECGTLRTTDSLNESTLVIENVGTLNISKKVNTERYLGSNQCRRYFSGYAA